VEFRGPTINSMDKQVLRTASVYPVREEARIDQLRIGENMLFHLFGRGYRTNFDRSSYDQNGFVTVSNSNLAFDIPRSGFSLRMIKVE